MDSETTLPGERLAHGLLIWRVCLTVVHVLAIVSSVFRICRRIKTRQFGLDDQFATASLVFDCLYFPTLWLRLLKSAESQVFVTWISLIAFVLVMGCARISLALSTARVIPPNQPMHFASICIAYILGAICIASIIQICITCGGEHATWPKAYPYECNSGAAFVIFRLSTDIFADISLILIPFWAFWRGLKLPIATRRLIKACFTASILTSLSSIFSSAILLSHNESTYLASVMGHLMGSTSLFVCNLLVVVTSFYRFFRAQEVNLPARASPPLASANPDSRVLETTSSTASDNSPQNRSSLSSIRANSVFSRTQPTACSADLDVDSYHLEFTEIYSSDSSHSRYGELQPTK